MSSIQKIQNAPLQATATSAYSKYNASGRHLLFIRRRVADVERAQEPSCFQQKPFCFRRAFNESHPAFVELSTKAILLSTELSMKVILLSESSWRDCFRRTYFFTIFSATIEMVNLKFFNKFAIYDWFKV